MAVQENGCVTPDPTGLSLEAQMLIFPGEGAVTLGSLSVVPIRT